MTRTPAQNAVRARALRRRHLQQRQTVIFGTIVVALLAIGLFAGAVWADILPSPVSVPIQSRSPTAAAALPKPCPPPETPPPAYDDVTVNVYNSTTTPGLGKTTSGEFKALGVTVDEVGNAKEVYYGSALIAVGVDGIPTAYLLASLIPDAQIKVIDREGMAADVTLGVAYESLSSPEEAALDPDLPIPTPDGCSPVDPDGVKSPAEQDDQDDQDGQDSEEG